MRVQQLVRCGAIALTFLIAAPLSAQAPLGKAIPTFLVYYGGAPSLTGADAATLAKFDLIDIDRFRYADISPTTWAAVKALNPSVQFYLYQMGPEAPSHLDAVPQVSLNGLGRYNVSRGHSMGSLNGNQSQLFLLDASGNRIYNVAYSNPGAGQYWHLMDFGSAAYQAYWVEAVRADLANQAWATDGVHADNCLTLAVAGGYSAASAKYPTDTAWSNAMTSFTAAVAAGLHGYGQKLWCNRGESRSATGAAAWLALDQSASPPDVVADEGAFAVGWGPYATQFYPEAEWKRQLDTIGAINNSKVAIFSHSALGEGGSGTDNWGRPVTYWQTLWYAMGSFLLAKNGSRNNAYFNFTANSGAYNRVYWYPEYDNIDLGAPVGNYTVSAVAGVNVYRREFEKGWVYVNPTATDVAAVTLPALGKILTRANLTQPVAGLPSVAAVALPGHNAVIALKDSLPVLDTTAPSVPGGLAATPASSTQVNLAWSASTDNVGVTGYKIFRGGSQIASTTAPSYADAGLSASTSYSYSVAAFDAAGNASAPSSAVAASTPAAPDTAAPSVPGGLAASAASTTQMNLAWSASTDNVGVAGYRVYRAGAQIATTTAPAYADSGLAPATTYSYTVAAFDAAGNTSAQSAAASGRTQTPPDATAPSKPAGLGASAVSGTRIDLAWSASSDNVGVTGYKVFRGGTQIATTAAPAYSDSGLTPATAYSYRVAAYDAAGNTSAQSSSVSATTRATRVRGDFDGDGKADVVWRNNATGQDQLWLMNGGSVASSAALATVADLNWSIAGIGDFNADGKTDLLWRNRATGEVSIWLMNGAAIASSVTFATVADLNWEIAGVADFNGDGKADILWRNKSSGANALWFMNGAAIASAGTPAAQADLNWAVAGAADFNGDGKADILWRNRATGATALWLMNGAATLASSSVATLADLDWGVAGVGDFDGDGKADILWRHAASGANAIWLMNGAAITGTGAVTTMPVGWSVAGLGDFDGDGKADILWRNAGTGQNTVFRMAGVAVASVTALADVAGASWLVALR